MTDDLSSLADRHGVTRQSLEWDDEQQRLWEEEMKEEGMWLLTDRGEAINTRWVERLAVSDSYKGDSWHITAYMRSEPGQDQVPWTSTYQLTGTWETRADALIHLTNLTVTMGRGDDWSNDDVG